MRFPQKPRQGPPNARPHKEKGGPSRPSLAYLPTLRLIHPSPLCSPQGSSFSSPPEPDRSWRGAAGGTQLPLPGSAGASLGAWPVVLGEDALASGFLAAGGRSGISRWAAHRSSKLGACPVVSGACCCWAVANPVPISSTAPTKMSFLMGGFSDSVGRHGNVDHVVRFLSGSGVASRLTSWRETLTWRNAIRRTAPAGTRRAGFSVGAPDRGSTCPLRAGRKKRAGECVVASLGLPHCSNEFALPKEDKQS